MDKLELQVIAKIYNNYETKFAIPRQSFLDKNNLSKIVFEKQYRDENALRGIEGFSHLWLLWGFSQNKENDWSPTVRPPRLGGNKRIGVFATRSPYRPNPIGLSSVKLEDVQKNKDHGTILIVSGADLMNGSPIYDIKPYLSFTDCHNDAVCGFADEAKDYKLDVIFSDDVKDIFDEEKAATLTSRLSQDPRPSYIDNPSRIFGFVFEGYNIKFKVTDSVVTVLCAEPIQPKDVINEKTDHRNTCTR